MTTRVLGGIFVFVAVASLLGMMDFIAESFEDSLDGTKPIVAKVFDLLSMPLGLVLVYAALTATIYFLTTPEWH